MSGLPGSCEPALFSGRTELLSNVPHYAVDSKYFSLKYLDHKRGKTKIKGKEERRLFSLHLEGEELKQ